MYCGQLFEANDNKYLCDLHQPTATLDVIFDYKKIKQSISRDTLEKRPFHQGISRYRELLPIKELSYDCLDQLNACHIGSTPLIKIFNDNKQQHTVFVKDDTVQPSGSLKDRASIIAILKAKEQNKKIVVVASTGNAAASLSCLSARMGMQSVVYIPKNAPKAKIIQNKIFGSKIKLINGSYNDALYQCINDLDHNDWYNRCTGINPYMTEGKKTVAYEIAEQLNWQVPDYVFVSVGDGSIISGVYKGFYDLFQLSWINCMPKIIGIQAKGSSYLYTAFTNKKNIHDKEAINAQTCADSISSNLPLDRHKAYRAVSNSCGQFVQVNDEQILDSIVEISRQTGIFNEPASAASFAGYKKIKFQIKPKSRIVIIATGSGLKDLENANNALNVLESKNTNLIGVM